ncbi:tRNA (guanosine(46)-N7)-methyltransferase TrmB [Allobaculum mucilyticum]|uniref:tRNA (guanosine(46)-N7)-methyltransferase TrmB n=1 Tax=Allobaculum mucilyticum TaxID=2834459 RepID=UPI001E2E91C7|nr:tRNA (guanosine(46)-N7)-methyltransferase TrmB [Allobaculum mucilyticum]UNT96374.1 tRNA (guanosine(46)-N7)-methyltransferase TrmB [Allobaculum mucilyticum]
MRMRRIPWAADYLKTSGSRIMDPASRKGSWKKENPARLHLEIGAGKGGYSAGMAALYPKEQFVAVEKNESAAGLAAKKFDEAALDNLSLIYGDGADLSLWFDPQEVDVIHLNFSDPWPKKRNAKRRLSAPAFTGQYRGVLADDGELIMKTDNAQLFEYSLLEFQKAGFVLQDVSVDFRREEHPEDVLTEYEEKFVQTGHPIYRAIWKKA